MKRKGLWIFYGTAALLLIIFTGTEFIKTLAQKNSAGHIQGDNVEELKAQDAENYKEFVDTIEGTATNMLFPEYWLTEKTDEVLFSQDEIEYFNNNNPSFVSYYAESKGRNYKLFMDNLDETIDGEAVVKLIDPELIKEYNDENSPTYIDGMLPGDDYWDNLEKNLNIDGVEDTVVPEYAICVDRTMARVMPSDEFAAKDPDEIYFDDFISAEVMPCDGVAIIHESRDGEWCYVISGSFCGWVRKEKLAVCKNREEWIAACKPDEFLLVTGSEIVLESTPTKTLSSGLILPMGTRLRLSADYDEQKSHRESYGCYRVDIPCRDADGKLYFEQSLIPVSKDVHVGFLNMTSESVIRQAFKFLGKIYGYGGSLCSNDCSGFVRQVYSCYGFDLPRNARAIAERADIGSIDCEKMTMDKRKTIFSQMNPGLLAYMDGHLMMYLGMKDDMPYVISSCATCIEPGEDSADLTEAYCVFVSGLDLKRKSGKTWLEDLKFILSPDYRG
ncbi:NlpC/P60 family protein [Butyrivibrio sp. JL13D10]|uniref:NlpC/P60 family protein n=1 Tax=Butyrivibrio sp. JL13D10 TaxID=3236815 RepID=UPI0038B64B22